MLHKWKNIISNWINCYFDGCDKKQDINPESLLFIISHLRENLNLDESKSSLLEANSIEDFINEKYPEFKFENGTVEPITQDELYMSASLLLYFVCVNSKDMDMKLAMCNKLSMENQEIILKFSKRLMDCSNISYRDVQIAITEACGQDIAISEASNPRIIIAETPPALRSLHGEVRRLQAALDAERFDRNYLQEELARTNLRLEKLSKDKEQYKLDIVNLKAKISMCCGQEFEAKGSETKSEHSAKLVKELQDMEERLVNVQGELDDVQYERNLFKSKVEELKRERDKLLAMSQEESIRANQLTEELEIERQQVLNLKGLVTELRQHNQLNNLDSSQLECDDPDATIPSINHNLSVCSEVCANIIEVQLNEERANIITLKEQVQSLQEQINEMSQKYEYEKREYETKISRRDDDLVNLKHRVNEEIDDKNKLKEHYNDVVNKLYTQINMQEKKLKDETNYFQQIIDSRVMEIQAMEEERSSLMRSISDETLRFENIIQTLKSELDTEKTSKFNMKDNYEKQLMQLNEKVLNRNNELVELQDKIFEKSEMIEQLRLDLKKEKELNEDISNKCNHEIVKLNEQRLTIETQLQEKIVEIEENNLQLEHKNQYIIETHSKIENLNKDIVQSQDNIASLGHSVDEKNATIHSLQTQLQNEIEFKTKMQDDMKTIKVEMSNKIEDLKSVICNLESDKRDVENIVDTMNMYLNDEKSKVIQLEITCKKLKETMDLMTEEIEIKTQRIKVLNDKLDEERYVSEEESREKDEMLQQTHQKYLNEVSEKDKLSKKLNIKCKELLKVETEHKAIQEASEKDKTVIISLEHQLAEVNSKYIKLQNDFNIERTELMSRISEIEITMKNHELKYETSIREKESKIETLNKDIENIQKIVGIQTEKVLVLEQDKSTLYLKLEEEISFKSKIEKEYQNQCVTLKDISDRLNAEINLKDKEIQDLKEEMKCMVKAIDHKKEELHDIEHRLSQENLVANKLVAQNNEAIKQYIQKIYNLETMNKNLEIEFNNEVQSKLEAIKSLKKEIEQLNFTIEEENSNHEIFLKEKDNVIETLESQLRNETVQLQSIQKEYEKITFTWEKQKIEIQESFELKDKKIRNLNDHIVELEKQSVDLNKIIDELKNKIEELTKEKTTLTEKIKNEYKELQANFEAEHAQNTAMVFEKELIVSQLNTEKSFLVKEKNELMEKNEILDKQLAEEKLITEVLKDEKYNLLRDKTILSQELLEEKSIRKLIEEEKNIISAKVNELQSHIIQDRTKIETLLNEKECLIQKIIDEKSFKEVAQKEVESLVTIKKKLEQAVKNDGIALKNLEDVKKAVDQQLIQVLTLTDSLKFESENLQKILTVESKEKEILNKENKELRVIREKLTNDLEKIKSEKLTIESLLSEEKAARDELESEKNSEISKLLEHNNKSNSELKLKQTEISNILAEMEGVKTEYTKLNENNKVLSEAIHVALNNMAQKLKDENISNEMLMKLLKQQEEELSIQDQCELIVNITEEIASEFLTRMKLSKDLEHGKLAVSEMRNIIEVKEKSICDLENHIRDYEKRLLESKAELSKQSEMYKSKLETKTRDITKLQNENASVSNELTDLKIQLEVKVHSLNEKLVDNENLTDKLKQTYESQINNLNTMISKLTNFLKDKTVEVELLEKEKEKLQHVIENKNKAMKLLEDEIKCHKQNQEKLVTEFESERVVFKNMVAVTESEMEDQKCSLNKVIAEHVKNNEHLKEELSVVKDLIAKESTNNAILIEEKEITMKATYEDLLMLKNEKKTLEQEFKNNLQEVSEKIKVLEEELQTKNNLIVKMEVTYKELKDITEKQKNDLLIAEENKVLLLKTIDSIKSELNEQINIIKEEMKGKMETNSLLERNLTEIQDKMAALNEKHQCCIKEKIKLENEKQDLLHKVEEIKSTLDSTTDMDMKELTKLKMENLKLLNDIEESKKVATNFENLMKQEMQKLSEDFDNEKIVLTNKYKVLQECQENTEKQLEQKLQDILSLNEECKSLKRLLESSEKEEREKDEATNKILSEKEALIVKISKELVEERDIKAKYQNELECKAAVVYELRQKLEEARGSEHVQKKEIQPLVKAQWDSYTVAAHEKIPGHIYASVQDKEHREHQVDTTPTSDLTHSSMESLKTISDLEMIIHDKNRTITTLQNDITYLKTIMAESENKLIDVTKDLEVSQDNCHQLSNQLKKLVHQKNEEIADLKRQVNKMSATENRASQIIKVSAKYQAIILKRVAEIKSTTVLKELTNFGNTTNCDYELRRSLNSGSITMEELENFLETTDKHLKKCSEKQIVLQKDRDRLAEVNKIHESEIINLKKFLTEMSISFKTFSSVKEVYTQKFSSIVSLQRTVRREILNLDGHITDSTMCKLERGYASVMQDLSECAMTMERWVERCVARTLSSEKMKQAFTSELDRVSLASITFQNTGLEVQLQELEISFQKLLEEVSIAKKGEGARSAQEITVMEVRAEYEDKLNRMKAKMKQLYQEQIQVFRDKQKEEVAMMERELQKARDKLEESSREYENHIKALTTELWKVGEKFLMKKEEADWLRRKQRSDSLMSLQHVHSAGLVPPQEYVSRPSDTYSLRSLPVKESKNEGGVHMSDEEGEVFDNRCLAELSRSPARLSELRWRNSLCPPHLKSSYPAETQFTPALHEDDIKCMAGGTMNRQQRKEVGITAYKKPGPPTPSKQAGRLSATDSELRESLRVEADPQTSRKTSTPSRLRSLFRSGKNDTMEGTPRSKRLSFFRKKQ